MTGLLAQVIPTRFARFAPQCTLSLLVPRLSLVFNVVLSRHSRRFVPFVVTLFSVHLRVPLHLCERSVFHFLKVFRNLLLQTRRTRVNVRDVGRVTRCMHAKGQPVALERIPAGKRAWSGPITAGLQRPAEGAHVVRAHSAPRFLPVLRGQTPANLINASSKGAAERTSTTRSAKPGQPALEQPPRRPRSTCARAPPAVLNAALRWKHRSRGRLRRSIA